MYVAHKEESGRLQTAEDHLKGVAELAETFSAAFGAGRYGFCAGMLHDAGKFSEEFQRHILRGGPKVDHSTAGAQAVLKLSPTGVGKILAYCAAGHHAGLPDGGSAADDSGSPTLSGRMTRRVCNFSPFYRSVDLPSLVPKSPPPIRMVGKGGFTASFFIRMLFSCLVDADFLDTERFFSGGTAARGAGESISVLSERLDACLARFADPQKPINRKRCEILELCRRKAEGPKGLYTLTVPTGGGKTLSSLAFALRHAALRGMNRVIYAIPYTSIIEQNAEVFREILGGANVLEHHSNFIFPDCGEDGEDPEQAKLKLAAENWDAPLIVTTNVQFFESLFSNRTSRCRKLHNIAGSVVIFDEAQMIPREYLQPCVRAVTELVLNYGCTAVLCSATQPELQTLFPPQVKSTELCENVPQLYEFFRRTRIVNAGVLDDSALADALNGQKQALCIVNTKLHAQNLYSAIRGEGSFHLSTLMTPSHRKRVLAEIRRRLKDGESCRVVSTSLIEAGVDVDFPAVYREEAGLDSEIQAAGRCNREGGRPAEESLVTVFRSEEKYRSHLPSSVRMPADLTGIVAGRFPDVSSPEAIRCYFETMYRVAPERLDRKKIVEAFERGAADNFNFPFAEVAEEFRFIETETTAVLIAAEPEAQEVLRRLQAGERSRDLFRLAGLYSVDVYDRHFRSLYDAGKAELLDGGIAVLIDPQAYSEETGLSLAAASGEAWFA